MKKITVDDILRICKGKLVCGSKEIECKHFERDTRNVKTGDVYIGIKGENFDGNTLYEKAFEQGASVAIVSGINPNVYKDKTIIIVEDTIKALQQIAEYKRNLYDIPVIAVTGSVGKTSTKDIVASVMSQKYKVLKTQGNLNNHIGLPITILQLEDHEAIVVEMGMNHFGEIRTLTNIAHPTMCIISNIGTSHIGNLGSRENILKAKLEILEGAKEKAPVIVNNDNDLLNKWAKEEKDNYNIKTYGIKEKSDLTAKNIRSFEDKSLFDIDIKGKKYEVTVPVGGNHFVYNALAAICVGIENGIEIEDIITGIKKFELTKKRMEVIKSKLTGATIINDTYNASYDSMKAGLEYLNSVSGNRKIAILGDMLELGEYEKKMHEKVGEEVAKNNIDILIIIGNASKNIANMARKLNPKIEIHEYSKNQEALEYAKENFKEGDIVLIKASNAMKLSEIAENLK